MITHSDVNRSQRRTDFSLFRHFQPSAPGFAPEVNRNRIAAEQPIVTYLALNRSTEETRDLVAAAQAGDETARDKLVRTHIGFVIRCAKAFYRHGGYTEIADLIQQGCIGLLKAINRFDLAYQSHGKTVEFSTYARFWIDACIRKELQRHGRTIRLPSNTFTQLRSLWKARTGLQGRTPCGPQELSVQTGLSPERIKDLDICTQPAVPMEFSLEDWHQSICQEPASAVEESDLERMEQHTENVKKLKEWLSQLPPNYRFVIQERYGLNEREEAPKSLREIARCIGVTSQNISYTEKAALKLLRDLARGRKRRCRWRRFSMRILKETWKPFLFQESTHAA